MPRTVNIHEAKTHLSRLLEEVRAGGTVVIAKNGQPVAELVPIRKVDLVFGGLADVIEFDDEAFVAADAAVREMFDEDLDIRDPA